MTIEKLLNKLNPKNKHIEIHLEMGNRQDLRKTWEHGMGGIGGSKVKSRGEGER